jgi:hypothetical protein
VAAAADLLPHRWRRLLSSPCPTAAPRRPWPDLDRAEEGKGEWGRVLGNSLLRDLVAFGRASFLAAAPLVSLALAFYFLSSLLGFFPFAWIGLL